MEMRGIESSPLGTVQTLPWCSNGVEQSQRLQKRAREAGEGKKWEKESDRRGGEGESSSTEVHRVEQDRSIFARYTMLRSVAGGRLLHCSTYHS